MLNKKIYFLLLLFICSHSIILYSNTEHKNFFTDYTHKVYTDLDIPHTIKKFYQKQYFKKYSIKDISIQQKGIEKLNFLYYKDMPLPSLFYYTPLDDILMLTISPHFLKNSLIKLNVNKTISKFNNYLGFYLHSTTGQFIIQLIFEYDNQKKIVTLPIRALKKYQFYFFQLENLLKHHKVKLRYILFRSIFPYKTITNDLYIKISSLYSYHINHSYEKHVSHSQYTSFFESIPSSNIVFQTITNSNQVINQNYIFPKSIHFHSNQELVLNLKNPQSGIMEIYLVFYARIQKSFLLRLKIPASNPHSSISIQLPKDVVRTNLKRYKNTEFLIHGIKFLPSNNQHTTKQPVIQDIFLTHKK